MNPLQPMEDTEHHDSHNDAIPSYQADTSIPDDSDEEEDECRVCRGPAEEGRPLLHPCKCSGSMGMVHQDCLISWLEVTRGDGRCEICKYKFCFDPQYAENTPDRLPAHEVILGLSSRFLAKWLPLALRITFAAFLWLVVAPYLTNCLYLGWIVKPSSILGRHETILSDIVSGAVMGATIIISFLSLMSFADFLRVLWQQPPGERQQPLGADRERRRENDPLEEDVDDELDQAATDRTIIDLLETMNTTKAEEASLKINETSPTIDTTIRDLHQILGDADANDRFAAEFGLFNEAEQLRTRANQLRTLAMEREARHHNALQRRPGDDHDDEDDFEEIVALQANEAGFGGRNNVLVEDVEDDDDDDESFESDTDDDDDDDEQEDLDVALMNENEADDDDVPPFQPLQDRAQEFDPMDPVLQDDQVDMEINVALDELLGLRGPISGLVRNLLWLLAFNATYLGIFGFVPKSVGSVIYSSFFNTTLCDTVLKSIPYVYLEDTNQTSVVGLLSSLEEESTQRNSTFKLSDFATVTLGYLSMASFIVLSRYGIVVMQKAGILVRRNSTTNVAQNLEANINFERIQRAQNVRQLVEGLNEVEDEGATGGIGDSIETALDATVAIIKVCVLLFMKMFLLPLSLGLGLDASTIRLFGHDVAGRLAFAGSDLFSFILLHWVAGITFMLLVTVFLLQLREVAHPDILARLIRPQEPQPDLLGNLMHETVPTHVKRMALSLAIYAPLLVVHVTIPIMLLHSLGKRMTFFHLHFYHLLTPQLQIPIELIAFHLSMLALLERYKNNIGGMQHYWMKVMCRKLGLTPYVLPLRVKEFEFVGTKAVFTSKADDEDDMQVDPFFSKLAKAEEDIDKFILSNIEAASNPIDGVGTHLVGEQRVNGERVLDSNIQSISFPTNSDDENGIFQLPTKIGRYRLRLEEGLEMIEKKRNLQVCFFVEVQGDEIQRPPEGWDDLGAGGAYVQGRWAWAKERKSSVEESIARRTAFRASPQARRSPILMSKVIILVVLSWCAVIFTALAIFSCPLAIGRAFYHLLRVPPQYIHDPLAFCVGAGLFFPTISVLTQTVNGSDENLHERCRKWLARFQRPPARKFMVVFESCVLWMVVAPLALGLSYEFALVKSPNWFVVEKTFIDMKTMAISWLMGTIVLNTWCFLLYCKFFTRRFWSNVGNGILEPPVNEDGNPNPNARNINRDDPNAENGLVWQGKQGRVAKFFLILRSVVLYWEWDTVDREVMIDDFVRPTTKEIASALVGSALSYHLALNAIVFVFRVQRNGFVLPLLGFVEVGIFRKTLFQVCMMIHVLFQIGSQSRSNIDRWFEAAHEAARDDRYLIGELLMNYNPGQTGG